MKLTARILSYRLSIKCSILDTDANEDANDENTFTKFDQSANNHGDGSYEIISQPTYTQSTAEYRPSPNSDK